MEVGNFGLSLTCVVYPIDHQMIEGHMCEVIFGRGGDQKNSFWISLWEEVVTFPITSSHSNWWKFEIIVLKFIYFLHWNQWNLNLKLKLHKINKVGKLKSLSKLFLG